VFVTSVKFRFVIFQVLTATSMKMTIFWDVASCSLVETDVSEMFTISITLIIMTTEDVNTSENSVTFYKTAQGNIPKDNDIHNCRRENLKSHNANAVPNLKTLTTTGLHIAMKFCCNTTIIIGQPLHLKFYIAPTRSRPRY
jgi:hypothetical protein